MWDQIEHHPVEWSEVSDLSEAVYRGVSSNGTKSGAKLKILDVKAFAGETVPRSANEAASGIQQ